jgi:type IV fimbrial biogenesis protein FimT
VRGMTLLELLFAIALAAVVLGTGVPAVRTWVLDARLTADVNAWVRAIQLARSEAAKRGSPVIVCPTDDTVRCGSGTGVMVYVNLDDAHPPQRSAAEPLLFAHAPGNVESVASNRAYYEFRPARRSTNGTIVFCDERGPAAAKAVIVSYTGRPRVDTRDADGRPLRCAGLT